MSEDKITQISLKEAELTLASIRSDIVSESENLSVLYKDRDAIQLEKVTFSGEMALERQKLEEERAGNASERAEIALQREQMVKEKDWHLHTVNELKTQNKLALKDLSWVNDKVLKAEDLIKEKIAEIALLDISIAEKQKLSEGVLILQDLILELEARKTLLEKENSFEKDNADEYMLRKRAELEQVLADKDSAIENKNQAQYELKTYTDELVTKQKDFAIYVQRLEEHYQKAFPELRITL